MNKAAGSEVLTAGPGLVSARARRLAAAKIGGKAMDMVNAQQALRTAAALILVGLYAAGLIAMLASWVMTSSFQNGALSEQLMKQQDLQTVNDLLVERGLQPLIRG